MCCNKLPFCIINTDNNIIKELIIEFWNCAQMKLKLRRQNRELNRLLGVSRALCAFIYFWAHDVKVPRHVLDVF